MVERYNCYVHIPVTRATGREITRNGEHVSATDYAKLEAENVELLGERDSAEQELYAANATLDALRGQFAPDKVISNSTCMKAVDILYPTPETPND